MNSDTFFPVAFVSHLVAHFVIEEVGHVLSGSFGSYNR